MSAILEMPEVRARVPRFTVENYERLVEAGAFDKRIELIRGVLVNKMSKSPLHSTLVRQIFLRLLGVQREGSVVFSERPIRLADSEPEPDAMIVRGQAKDFATKHPTQADLVVEVAVSSAELDRENASLYAESGVTEYWIVLGPRQQVEVYRQPEGGVYQRKRLYSMGEVLTCESVPGLQVALADLFA